MNLAANKSPECQQIHHQYYIMNKLDSIFKRALSRTRPKNISHFGVSVQTLLSSKILPLREDPIEADIPDILIHLIDYLSNDQCKFIMLTTFQI